MEKTLQIVLVRTNRMRRITLPEFQLVNKGLYRFLQFTNIFYFQITDKPKQ